MLVISFLLDRNDSAFIGHDLGHDSKNEETEVEEEPLDVSRVRVDFLTDDLGAKSDNSKNDRNSAAINKGVNAGLGGYRPLRTGLVKDCSHCEDVEDLTDDEEGNNKAVNWHVIVDIEEAYQGSKDAGNNSINN